MKTCKKTPMVGLCRTVLLLRDKSCGAADRRRSDDTSCYDIRNMVSVYPARSRRCRLDDSLQKARKV